MQVNEFQPTVFDHSIGAFFDHDDPRGNWLVAPVSRTRDTGPFEDSNFETCLSILGGESETVEVHRFGHWGPGWFEVIICDPVHSAQLEEIERTLEDYPVLDDEDHSRREWEAAEESWSNYGLSDFIDNAGIQDYHDLIRECLESQSDMVWRWHLENACEPYFFDGGGCNFRFGKVDQDDLLALIWECRKAQKQAR